MPYFDPETGELTSDYGAASVATTIDSQLALSQSYATQALARTTELTDALYTLVSDIDSSYRISYASAAVPDLSGLAIVDPANRPAPLSLDQASQYIDATEPPADYAAVPFTDFTFPSFDTFSKSLPVLNTPTTPETLTATLPTAPSITVPTTPDVPDYTLPDVPSYEALVLPDAPTFTPVAAFAVDAPTFSYDAPAGVIAFSEEAYLSALKDSVTAKLKDQVDNGGTGLAASVEADIWNRGMTREAEAQRKNLENAIDDFAASGFPAPAGALAARLVSIRQELENRAEDLSRKIAEDQARLAQNNSQFAITSALSLEQLELQHHNNVAERAFAYARATQELALSIFNARVAQYNAALQAYQTQAQVYEINVRAALQELENYKALLEGKRIEASIRKDEVDLYRAQIAGVEAVFGLYRAQLDAVRTTGEVERLKLDVFRSEMDGYIGQIRAKESEYSVYRAQIDSEQSKITGYTAEVDAYRATVQAKASTIDAQKLRLTAEVERERNRIEQYKTKLEQYRTEVDLNKSAVGVLIEKYRADNEAYRSEISKAEAQGRLNLEAANIETRIRLANVAETNAQYRKEADTVVALANLSLGAAAEGAKAQSQVASAALSQINTMSQLSGTFDNSTQSTPSP